MLQEIQNVITQLKNLEILYIGNLLNYFLKTFTIILF